MLVAESHNKDLLGGSSDADIAAAVLERAFAVAAAEEGGLDPRTIDYYGFLRIVGKGRIEWPR